MPAYAVIDADGYPTGGGESPASIPEGAVPLHRDQLAGLARLRWQDGRWQDRPVLPGPQVDGGDLWFDGVPDDAVISITDAITGVDVAVPLPWAGATGVTLAQGSWLVRITGAKPWLDFEALIDVAGGSPQRGQDALANAKRAARARINEIAGRARLALVTDIPGQTAIYQSKENEARAYLAAGAPEDLTEFPAIAAEVGITAPTAYQLAQIWLWMAALFRQAAAASERARLSAIAAVDAATTLDAVERVLANA